MEKDFDRSCDFAYSGTDNLEGMREARNYNAWLARTVAAHLRGKNEILDFGAGIGYFAARLRDLGFSVTCIDADQTHLRRLEGDGFACAPSLREAGRGRFGGAYTLNVLEHVENDDAILGELRGVLAPGGVLVVYVPAFQILFSSMDRKVGHFRRYRASSLKRKIEAQGLCILRCASADILGFLATLFFRAVGNRRGDLNPWGVKTFDRFVFPLSLYLDRLTRCWVGKNLLIVAQKPEKA